MNSSKNSETPDAAKSPPAANALADAFSIRAQAAFFFLLLAFLGFVGWKAWAPPTQKSETVFADRGMIDLNRADAAELMLLDSIGPELAKKIVAYREQHGPFEGLADLQKVNGIGPATLERIRPRIVLSWPGENPRKPMTTSAPLTIAPAALATKIDLPKVIDPNTATLLELQNLPGIGPKKAQAIIDQRSQKSFTQISDLRRVPGIGPKTLEKIAPLLKIGDGALARVQ